MQAWVGTQSNAANPTLGLSHDTCLHTMSDDDQTRLHKKHKQHYKYHHHGGGATRPSSGVDLMNPCRRRNGWPVACFFDAVIAGFY